MSTNADTGAHVDAETQDMLRSFVSEAFDSLDSNEPIVEDLRNESNEDSVNAIFRVFHTLKGLSGFFEMLIINKVTHEAETLLDIMRKENKSQSEETITVIYQTFDFLRDLLQRVNSDFTDQSGAEEAEDMILILKDTISTFQAEDAAAEPEVAEEQIQEVQPETQEPVQETEPELIADEQDEAIDFDVSDLISNDMLDQYLTNANELIDTTEKNLLDLETNPDNDVLVGETFGAVHSLKGNSGFMGYKEIEEISMDMETILDAVRDKSLEIDQTIITVLLSNIETIRDRLEKISQGEIQPEASADSEPPAATPPEPAPQKVKPVEEKIEAKPVETPKDSKTETKPKSKAEPAKKAAPKKAPAKKPGFTTMQRKDIRVETEKIDKLFDLVGELITIETMVTSNPDLQGLELPNFNKSANMLNKITRDLQEISMSIRMMPLEGLFNKMKRLVRDVSLKMNKKVNLLISGQHTEMDKNVIDEISDPLVHILRNAIDHGVESPEDRVDAGKEEIGTVDLSARYEGNEILIIVKDDGAGINRDIVLAKALDKGLVMEPIEDIPDKDAYMLIFEPGFSTAKQVTDISGRGVGMDVVKKNIEKLRGSIDIDSKLGQGSKFTLRIPLTLAIMEAMLIRINNAIFALPILAIRESFRPMKENVTITMDGLEVVKVREEILPVIRLHEHMHVEPDSPNLEDGILLLIETRGRKICLFADEIVGQQQAVIKNLSEYIGKVDGLTGCMILGDGSIGLILDIESLIGMSQSVPTANA